VLLSDGDVTSDLAGVRLIAADEPAPDVVILGGAGPEFSYPAPNGLTGVLVRTGKYRPQALRDAPGAPDHVIDSVADLPAPLERLARAS
jgi:HAD-hyrolase-like